MSADPAAAIGAFARTAPLAFAAATFAAAVGVALALGPGRHRAAAVAAVGSLALTLGLGDWGWRTGLVVAVALAVVVARSPRRTSKPASDDARRAALLLGRKARLGGDRSRPRVRLDGRAWRARVEGMGGASDACVRIVRVERDGRLVVRLTSG